MVIHGHSWLFVVVCGWLGIIDDICGKYDSSENGQLKIESTPKSNNFGLKSTNWLVINYPGLKAGVSQSTGL